MKKLILLGLALLPVVGFSQSNKFVLNCKIAGLDKHAKIYLTYFIPGKVTKDSATIQNGVFHFSGTVTEPLLAQLTVDHTGKSDLMRNVDEISLYLEKGIINVTGKDSVKKAVITGSKINADEKKYAVMIDPPIKEMDLVNAALRDTANGRKKNESLQNDLHARLNKARTDLRMLQTQFIRQNPDSFVSLTILSGIARANMYAPDITPLFKGLSANVRSMPTGKKFDQAIKISITTALGAMAPVFTENDVNNKPVSLADYRGKYVLVDFWASWCGPCRRETPNVVKAYNSYKGKKFDILGISLDGPNQKAAWLAAIKTDGMEWTQVSDLKSWNNEAAVLYGLDAIPQNFLIDPTGKIIGKNLFGEELTKKLASLFN